jgi:hypothetical protein
MGRFFGSAEPASFARMRRPRSKKNCSSERQSARGSTAFACHCSSRCVLVNVPSFSVWAAAGMKKTSVPISSVFSSPLRISGPSFHHEADSISWKSRTTTHSAFAIANLCSLPWADPTAGFSPTTKKPGHLPSSIRFMYA